MHDDPIGHNRRLLARTAHVGGIRGEQWPLPIIGLDQVIADLMTAAPGAERTMLNALAHLREVRFGHNMETPPRWPRRGYRIETGIGTIRIGLAGEDLTATLEIGEGLTHRQRRLAAHGRRLPTTMLAACVGRTAEDVVELPAGHPLRGHRITAAENARHGAWFTLDTQPRQLRLDELADAETAAQTIAANEAEALAIAA